MQKLFLSLCTSKNIFAILFMIFGSIALYALTNTIEKRPPRDIEKENCESNSIHRREAVAALKNRLKAPSTAKMGDYYTTYKGDCLHETIGIVDAQNSYGAMLRSYFTVVTRYDKEKKYIIVESVEL